MSNESAAVDPAAVFRRSWHVYQKFVTHNWMRHHEVYAALQRVLRARGAYPLAIADFGCGDAACTIAALEPLQLRRFVAVDRVGPLLESARQALSGRGREVTLMEADLSAAVATAPADPLDILLAAYSLHHLSLAEKQRWLTDALRWVRPTGRLVWIDLLRQPRETRRQYLDRFFRHAAQYFGAFDADEQALVREHVETYDFPETQAVCTELCTTAGWTAPRLAYRDSEGFYGVLVCAPAS